MEMHFDEKACSGKVMGTILLIDCLNHRLWWILGLPYGQPQQDFRQKILISFVIDKIFYYKKKKLGIFITYSTKKIMP